MMKIKVNMNLGDHNKGDIVKVEARDGVPTSPFWRKRLRDAKIDGCCEIVQPRKSTKKGDE